MPIQILFDEPPVVSDYDFRRADFQELQNRFLAVNWEQLFEERTIEEAVSNFCDIINEAIPECVPLRRTPPKPAWSNAQLRKLKRLRSSALRKYCNSRSPFTKLQFTQASTDYWQYNKYLYTSYVTKMQRSLKRNPKLFWNFVNSKRKETGLPRTMFLGTEVAESAYDKCSIFAKHFKLAFNEFIASPEQVDAAFQDTPRDVLDLNSVRF